MPSATILTQHSSTLLTVKKQPFNTQYFNRFNAILPSIWLLFSGLENEGWFDPWLLMAALKAKCVSLGVEFVKGEVVDIKAREERYSSDTGPVKRNFLEDLVVITEENDNTK